MLEPSIKKRKILEKITLHIKNDQDDDDVESSNKVNIEYIKQDLKEVIDYNCNTTIYHSDGSISITPHYFENLPNEILDQILVYLCDQQASHRLVLQSSLHQLTLINRQFYHCTNRLLWHSPCISNTSIVERFLTSLANTQLVQQWTTRSTGVRNGKFHHPVPHNILTARHHIRQMNIIVDAWDNIQLASMLPYVYLLEILKIKEVNNNKSKISDVFLHGLPRYCPYVFTLSLIPLIIKRPTCLETLTSEHGHRLCELELSIHLHHHQPLHCIFESLVRCTSLTILRLYSKQENIGVSHLTEHMIRNIAKLKKLVSFAFIGNAIITTIDLFVRTVDIATTWPRLSSLRIDSGDLLNDTFMIPFIESHPHLKYLNLSMAGFSNATLDTISIRLPHLIYVRFVGNHIITSDSVYKLIRRCPDLKQADFSWCSNLISSMIEFKGLQLNQVAVLTPTQIKKIRQRQSN